MSTDRTEQADTDQGDGEDTQEPTVAPEAAQEPQEGAQEPEEAQEPEDGKEAAKYRRRLRETETERDALTQRLTGMQRAEVDRLATAERIKPGGLWASGVTLADLLDAAGDVDPAKVRAAVDNAVTALGIQRAPGPGYVRLEGSNPSRRSAGTSWESAFSGE